MTKWVIAVVVMLGCVPVERTQRLPRRPVPRIVPGNVVVAVELCGVPLAGADDIVVVIKGTLRGLVLDDAKRQLASLIDRLPDGTRLGIVTYYGGGARTWKPQLVPLWPSSRDSAQTFVERLRTEPDYAGATTALRMAAKLDTRHVVFMSDGWDDDLSEVAHYFEKWGIRVDTIALGLEPDHSPLEKLAASTGGVAVVH